MYKVVVAPSVSEILIEYAEKCAQDNGIECALDLADSFERATKSLEELPQRGVNLNIYRHVII